MTILTPSTEALLTALSQQLLAKEQLLCTAESCTGGLLAASCTEIAGSSLWFERGYVTYSNAAKHEALNVPNNLIERFGAVSQEVAQAMALGAIKHSHAHWSVSITGIAGPTGGTPQKPVGLVWMGFAYRQPLSEQTFLSHTESLIFNGNRHAIRQATVEHVLSVLLRLMAETAITS